MNEPTPLQEAIQTLREDSALLELALLGAQAAIDHTTLSCLLRVSDLIRDHIRELDALTEAQ